MERRVRRLLVASIAAVTAVGSVAAGVYASASIIQQTASLTAASAAPVAPYMVFTMDGREGSGDLVGAHVFQHSAVMPGANGEDIMAQGFNDPPDSRSMDATFRPPTGEHWAEGSYELRGGLGGAGYAGIVAELSGNGAGAFCPSPVQGSLVVHQVTRGDVILGAHVVGFAATFVVSCGGKAAALSGEVRMNTAIGYQALSGNTAALDFGGVVAGTTSPAQSVTYTSRGSDPVTFGSAAITGSDAGTFAITGDTCSGATLHYDDTCSVTVTASPANQTAYAAALSIPNDTAGGSEYVTLSATGIPEPPPVHNEGTFYPLTPVRLLDTRIGQGAPLAKLGSGATLTLDVAGAGGVPESGVSAVVLNVTATNATAPSYLTVYPSGQSKPLASSLNFVGGWTGANMVTVGLGDAGGVDIFNNQGKVDVIADVVGYYAADNSLIASNGAGSQYNPLVPGRIFDSREDWGHRLAGGDTAIIPFTVDPDWDPHFTAVAVNVTAVDPVGAGYFTTWSGATDPPLASTLNYAKGGVVPNMAIVPVSWCYECGGYPAIAVTTNTSAHVVVDVLGVFDDAVLGEGLRFTPLSPVRIADSRLGQGLPGALGPKSTGTITAGPGIVTPGTYGLALNVTAVSPTAAGYVSVWPSGVDMPLVSNLNTAPGQTLPNSVYTLLGDGDAFDVYNHNGSTHIIADVVGTFYYLPDVLGAGFTPQAHGGSTHAGEQAVAVLKAPLLQSH